MVGHTQQGGDERMETTDFDAPTPDARGHVRRRGWEALEETCFWWRDPETGERLSIALDVSAAFRERLAAAGFQPAAEPTGTVSRSGDLAGPAAPAA